MRTCFFVLVLAFLLYRPALAGSIYKCLDGGRVSYSDRPCAGVGTTLAVPDAPPPDPALQERLERNRATLAAIEKARLAQATREERDLERAQRAALAERKRCDKLRLQRQWADEDLARQRDDAKETARLKAQLAARRQAESLALECPA